MSAEQKLYYQAKLAFETDAWDLHQALSEGADWLVIDGRSAQAYEQEHIPGALSLPHRTISVQTTQDLARDKTYVCYCDGIGCNASTKTALKLLELGFQVKELLGGLDWWKRDGYPTQGLLATAGNEQNDICGCEG